MPICGNYRDTRSNGTGQCINEGTSVMAICVL